MADESIPENSAYVYAIKVDGVVRYIGKGTGPRALLHEKRARGLLHKQKMGKAVRTTPFYNRLADAISGGAVVSVEKILQNISDAVAFELEIQEIAKFPLAQLWNATDGGLGVSSAIAKIRWADPAYREAQRRTSRSLEHRKRKSEAAKITQNDPELCERRSASQRLAFAKPEVKSRLSTSMKERWADPEMRAKFVAARKADWANPETREKLAAARKIAANRPEWRERFRNLWKDPEWRAALLEKRAKAKRTNAKSILRD